MHRPVNPTVMVVPASIDTMPMATSPSSVVVVVGSPESSTPAVVEISKESSPDAGTIKSSPEEDQDPVKKEDCNDGNGGGGDDDKHEETTADDTMSRREQIRAKLRASEKRLLSFTSTSSSDGGGFLNQMATVHADLKKIEEQKSQLEIELNKLKCATDNDEFLKEKMMGIKQGFDRQVEKIQSLQDEVQCKDDEIDRLHEELVRKIRRIVELEFDLETHEVHYTNYSAEQFKLGEDALEEIKQGRERERASSSSSKATSCRTLGAGGDDMSTCSSSQFGGPSSSSNKKNSMGPRKAQQLITKLLEDLEDLEERYKYDKLDYATKLQKAHIVNDQLRTRIEVLENELASSNNNNNNNHNNNNIIIPGLDTKEHGDDETDGGQSASVAPPPTAAALEHVICETNQFLRKRVKTLEARRALACKDIERFQTEFRALKKTVMSEKEDHKTQVKGLRTENEALKARIAELEAPPTTEKSKKNGGGGRRRSILGKMRFSKDDGGGVHSEQHYEEIEQRIHEAFNKICRLEAERDIKDRQIATLKNEVSSLRMKDITNGKLDGTDFSPIDTEILRSPASRRVTYDGSSGGECDTRSMTDMSSGDNSNSYVVDLQLQLQEAQQLLVKKDQELVIEQAKAASTAAGLLTRITELSGAKVDDRSGKQLPPR